MTKVSLFGGKMNIRNLISEFILILSATALFFAMILLNSCSGGYVFGPPRPQSSVITINLSPDTFSFACKPGEIKNSSMTISVSGATSLEWEATKKTSWLILDPVKGKISVTNPTNSISLKVDCNGLTNGDYSDTITVLTPSDSKLDANASVNLKVTENPQPIISLDPNTFSLECMAGRSTPVTGSMTVQNSGGGVLAWTASENVDWLTISPHIGTAPSTVSISASCLHLTAGSNPSADITVTGTNALNSPRTARVALTVKEPPEACVLDATPDWRMGPFTSTVTATFTAINASTTTASIKCYEGDADHFVPINLSTKTAIWPCNYPAVPAYTEYKAQAVGGQFFCEKKIINLTSTPPITPVCDYTKCDLTAKGYFSFKVYPEYHGCPSMIDVFDPATLCNNGGDPCKSDCRVRGSQDGENICAMIEDQTDYDWNDFYWTTTAQHFADGSTNISIRELGCDTAANDSLHVIFFFDKPKRVKDLDTGVTGNGILLQFTVWDNCHGHTGQTRSFLITE